MTKEAMLYEKLENNQVQCFLCNHYCRIKEGDSGLCRVRQNIEGSLKSLVYGKAVAAGADPIEKKPLYHFLPGSFSYSLATVGCNFHCSFCQNWQISQGEKKALAKDMKKNLDPADIVEKALANDCRSISYTYTEPTVFFEYAYDTACLAKEKNLYNNFVTNGYLTKKALDKINPYLDAANVDLKSFSNYFYQKKCGGSLQPVLDSIAYLKKLGVWVEVTTLVIPGQNDSQKELSQIAQFIASIDSAIPWHISRFRPDYKDFNNHPTPVETLNKAYKAGEESGLQYVYLGNVGRDNSTYCPACKEKVIERHYFETAKIKIKEGKCLFCGNRIKGLFNESY